LLPFKPKKKNRSPLGPTAIDVPVASVRCGIGKEVSVPSLFSVVRFTRTTCPCVPAVLTGWTRARVGSVGKARIDSTTAEEKHSTSLGADGDLRRQPPAPK
jgi:hypothetical protein